jgi:hypothetical protein
VEDWTIRTLIHSRSAWYYGMTMQTCSQSPANTFSNRADLNCAISMGTNPVFPCPEIDQSDPSSPPQPSISEEPATNSSGDLNKTSTRRASSVEALNMELKENFNNLKRLALINAEKKEPSGIAKEEGKRNGDTLYQTERSLLTLSNTWGPGKFVTSGCLAAIIFIDNQLRGINFRARIMDRVVGRLQLSISMVLDDISKHDVQKNAARAILWALFVGAIAAETRNCRGWFVEHLLDFCDVLDIQTWEEMEKILRGFLWPSTWQTQSHVLWNEVEENRMMKYTTFPEATTGENMGTERDPMEWF